MEEPMKVRPTNAQRRKKLEVATRPEAVRMLDTYGTARKGAVYNVVNGGTLNGVPVLIVDADRKTVVPLRACQEIR